MLIMKDRLIDVPIMSLHTGSQIAQTESMIIDPRDLTIKAFYCKGDSLDFYPAVLYVSDIRESGHLGFIVDHADKLMDPHELVRLQEILKFNFHLIGKKVIDTSGRKIGSVSDFSVDNRAYSVQKLTVSPTTLKMLSTAERLIDRSQITEINERAIVVKEPTVEERHKAPKLQQLADNPFRRSQPMQGGSSAADIS